MDTKEMLSHITQFLQKKLYLPKGSLVFKYIDIDTKYVKGTLFLENDKVMVRRYKGSEELTNPIEIEVVFEFLYENFPDFIAKDKVQFINYDGVYPCLCSGTLTIRVGEKEYKIKDALISGGGIISDEDEDLIATEGPWELDESNFPKELTPYFKEILECVNANVPYGCCGGCI